MKKIKGFLSNLVFKHVFKLPLEKDILTIDQRSGVCIKDGRVITGEELLRLKNEAEYIKNTELYRILINTPVSHARQIMFTKSTNFDDMLGGKFLLYTISIQENIIDRLTKKS